MLMWKIVSRVQLKDQHMIDTRLPPAIRVNPQQEEKLNQQETATVDAYQWPDVLITNEKSTWEGRISQTAGLSTRLYTLLHCYTVNVWYISAEMHHEMCATGCIWTKCETRLKTVPVRTKAAARTMKTPQYSPTRKVVQAGAGWGWEKAFLNHCSSYSKALTANTFQENKQNTSQCNFSITIHTYTELNGFAHG